MIDDDMIRNDTDLFICDIIKEIIIWDFMMGRGWNDE